MKMTRKKRTAWAMGSVLAIIMVLGVSGLAYLASLAATLPDPSTLGLRQVSQSTKIYDRTGNTLLYEIYGNEKRTVVPLKDIPDSLRQATIAAEDQSFYGHSALDFRAIARAIFTNLLKGKLSEGGSTITQQLAKNTFLSSEKTFSRKFKEMLLAVWLERHYSKDKILELYLNQIPYGANVYGVEAASQTYFNKSAKDLTLPESAVLASMLKAPSYYSPWGGHLDELLARKDYVLKQMLGLGFINQEQKDAAEKTKLIFAPQNTTDIKAPHFVMAVQDYLNQKYGEDFVRTAGLKVITTLDWDLQQKAEEAVKTGALRNEDLYQGTNAALVAEDASSGQVLALVGSRDYFDTKIQGNFNVATQGLRQPGSTLKPFIYLTAFREGYTPDTVLFDLPTEFDTTGDADKSYKPQNFDEKFLGPITMKEALAQSRNIPSVKTLYLVGIDSALETAHQFGITTLTERGRYGLSLVLGGGEVRLVDLVSAYATMAREGEKHDQTMILSVKDSDDKTLEEYKDKTDIVSDPQYPRLINSILSDIELRRPLFANSINETMVDDHEIALKTGTTNDYRDAWAIGYTPNLVVGVWAGNNDNTPMQRRGSSILAAVPIWHEFMAEALKDKIPANFNSPEPVYGNKPILRGQYLVNNPLNNNRPEIHDILYYVQKNNPEGDPPVNPADDPQFNNWETPVMDWLKNNASSTIISQ